MKIQRIIAVICTLAKRGLPFRGSNEQFGPLNNGNFLGLLELIAKFDPFLQTHVNKYGNFWSGKPSYLSKTICEEIIQLMARKVKGVIVADVKKAGYFSFSVDSTPDISHTDQLTIIIRYVAPEDGLPNERFLTFLELKITQGKAWLIWYITISLLSLTLTLENAKGSLMTMQPIWLVGTMEWSKKSSKKTNCKIHSMRWSLFKFGGPFSC